MGDLIEFFGDEYFDAAEYVKKFYENNAASGASARCEELEALRRQTEESLRQEVVRNYQTFMHATEQIQSMERDIDALRSLLTAASDTLATFQSIRLVERQEPGAKPLGPAANNSPDAFLRTAGAAGARTDGASGSSAAPARGGLKLPEWLDKAPTELEELLLERKHETAVKLIRQVKAFSANVRNATNLGQGVAAIFAQADRMAADLSCRLITEITGTNTFTAWGFREHKKNFELLIDLGYADAAAAAFVKERSALIRRSLHLVEATADPLTYVREISGTFFGQVQDTVTAFLKLFCGSSAAQHQTKAAKTGRSAAYMQVYSGMRACGSAPFCRLVTWLDDQVDQYARLVGRQVAAVGLGAHAARAADSVLPLLNPPSQSRSSRSAQQPQELVDPVVCTLFATVSLMLEDSFGAAARLNRHGFPVGVALASRLMGDVSAFLDAFAKRVCDAVLEAASRDTLALREYRISPPEALLTPTLRSLWAEKGELYARFTTCGAAAACEARTLLECCLMLLDPPPPPPSAQASPADAADAAPAAAGGSYYSRAHFSDLQPQVLKLVTAVASAGASATLSAALRRDDEGLLSRAEAAAARESMGVLGGPCAALLALWCGAMFPEVQGRGDLDAVVASIAKACKSAAAQIQRIEDALPPEPARRGSGNQGAYDDDVDDMAAADGMGGRGSSGRDVAAPRGTVATMRVPSKASRTDLSGGAAASPSLQRRPSRERMEAAAQQQAPPALQRRSSRERLDAAAVTASPVPQRRSSRERSDGGGGVAASPTLQRRSNRDRLDAVERPAPSPVPQRRPSRERLESEGVAPSPALRRRPSREALDAQQPQASPALKRRSSRERLDGAAAGVSPVPQRRPSRERLESEGVAPSPTLRRRSSREALDTAAQQQQASPALQRRSSRDRLERESSDADAPPMLQRQTTRGERERGERRSSRELERAAAEAAAQQDRARSSRNGGGSGSGHERKSSRDRSGTRSHERRSSRESSDAAAAAVQGQERRRSSRDRAAAASNDADDMAPADMGVRRSSGSGGGGGAYVEHVGHYRVPSKAQQLARRLSDDVDDMAAPDAGLGKLAPAQQRQAQQQQAYDDDDDDDGVDDMAAF